MHSSSFKYIRGEPMGYLILFRVRVVVGFLLDAGALYLFIYAFPLISNGKEIYHCIYRLCSSFNVQI
jgi:hypothetical protein